MKINETEENHQKPLKQPLKRMAISQLHCVQMVSKGNHFIEKMLKNKICENKR